MMQYLDDAVTTCENLLTSEVSSDARELAISWAEACQSVGNILTSMGFVEEAYPWRSMAFDPAPNSAKFYAASGRAYCQCELWDQAIYFCQKTLEHQPNNVSVRQRLAKVYHQLGEHRKESEVLDELLNLHPKGASAEGHYHLGQVLSAQGKRQAAINAYKRAIYQDAEYVAAYYALGEIWSQEGRWQTSVELFEKLIERCPEVAMAHYQKGRAHRLGQQTEAAISCFRQALKLDPELHWAYMGLLNTLMQMQRWDEVLQICQGITHFGEKFPWLYCFMGNAFANKGESQQAASCHQQAFAFKGWQRCADQGYEFERTWFSENIELWQSCLSTCEGRFDESVAAASLGERTPIQALSLGSGDDSILLWLADQVLTKEADRLTCITSGVSEQLEKNLTKCLQPEKIVLSAGDLPTQLSAMVDKLAPQTFDLIVIQSDRKEADFLQAIATSIWPHLSTGGILFFKDYQWQHPSNPSQSSKPGIDAFIASVAGELIVLHQAHQVILKKEGPSVA